MKSILISLIILFSLKSDPEFKFVAEKKGDYTAVSVDDFGNIYLINSYKNLLKFIYLVLAG